VCSHCKEVCTDSDGLKVPNLERFFLLHVHASRLQSQTHADSCVDNGYMS
jgi:hypothetical protein